MLSILAVTGPFTLVLVTIWLSWATQRLGREAKRSADVTAAGILYQLRDTQISHLESVRVVVIDNMRFPGTTPDEDGSEAVLIGITTSDLPILLSGAVDDNNCDMVVRRVFRCTGEIAHQRGFFWATLIQPGRMEGDTERFRLFLNEGCDRFARENSASYLWHLSIDRDCWESAETPRVIDVPRNSWLVFCIVGTVPPGIRSSRREFYTFHLSRHQDDAAVECHVQWATSGPSVERRMKNLREVPAPYEHVLVSG